ncbi:NAD(P)H-binding protein [Conexibacter arvalis]|uniref:Uncharacterized protein YbjT (DUF2867 family) n=1 Tax=Conexibacter arvalis TaxID=912552 RepID=A0A840IC76_9ACTN|nr:NAD(P)H-binding protein [Conexibacter arvalis]MBB4662436.1 uncharacterized protein YbjT (DUF2867 family) [Conexibacter arvalis]
MARVLIVGCGCRGQALARALRARGHAVRGTTRTPERRAAIEAAGAEAWTGDPDRIATLSYALDGVTVLCWLLGSARGTPEALDALHGPRLRMLLERSIDTTVRGVLYEAAGSAGAERLAGGAETVRAACTRSEIPFALLEVDPDEHAAWLAAAVAGVEGLLEARRPAGR